LKNFISYFVDDGENKKTMNKQWGESKIYRGGRNREEGPKSSVAMSIDIM
jgi:hypothetical protein